MIALLITVLATGAKGLFENPGFLIGVPLVTLGALGALVALTPIELRWWEQRPAAGPEVYEGHPGPETYVKVGLVLAVVTLIEVVIYYIDLAQGALLAMLLVLSAMKFLLVVLWFMHLRFDSQIFSTLFAGGMALALALFIVVLATLGASLV